MNPLRQRIAADLAAAGLQPLHRFGQNFMIDARALDLLVETSGAAPGVRIAEVGPGTGVLTSRLLERGAHVFAVEIDRGLSALLTSTLVPQGLVLVHGDALASKNALHPALCAFAAEDAWRLCANLPYDVALPVLLNAVALPRPPAVIAATVQYEAALRLVSQPGEDAWGASACVFAAAGTPRLLRRLPPQCFHPAPRVDSAIIAWTPHATPLQSGFGAFCRALFSYRRKHLRGALRDAGVPRELAHSLCSALGFPDERRMETLTPAEMLALHAGLAAASPHAAPEPGHDHESGPEPDPECMTELYEL